jgi:predicted O-methyltransferase YrrM
LFETVRRHPLLVLSEVAKDPLDAFAAVHDGIVSRFERRAPPVYEDDPDWEQKLSALLGIPANTFVDEFWPRWDEVNQSLRDRGMKVGPFSFYAWNDGDPGFVRALWRMIRHLRPEIVVETGVAHGLTSRFILEACLLNGAGTLWSIDLPPFNPERRPEVGVAVNEERLRARWSYIKGTSRRRLPRLLAMLPRIDVFIHDSMHSDRNMTFEFDLIWQHLRPGGILVADDVDASTAFYEFTQRHGDCPYFICAAEPMAPDMRRYNEKGMFGVIYKSH